jgi:hypothetical protein
MSKIPRSRFATLSIALSVTAAWTAHADAPSACQFLTPAIVSAALGKPVTGGAVSMMDHSGATASNCTYRAGMTMILLSVDERGTAGAAMKEYQTQLDNSHIRDEDKKGASDEQKTIPETGIGEAAFSDDMTNGSVLSITAVHGSRVFTLGIVGAASVPHERVRSLIQAAVNH